MDKSDIKVAALQRFANQGYHATTLRQLAQDLGVTPAAFYYHYRKKEEIIVDLIQDTVQHDLAEFKRITSESGDNVVNSMIHRHVVLNCVAQVEANIVAREWQFLPEPYLGRVRGLIQEYQHEFTTAIGKSYNIDSKSLALTTRAILAMGASVSQWYRPDGDMSPDDIADEFTKYADAILDAAST